MKNNKIRLTESQLTNIIKKVVSENVGDTQRVPDCYELMAKEKRVGGGAMLLGPIDKIEFNNTVAPQYQGFQVFKGGKLYCIIRK